DHLFSTFDPVDCPSHRPPVVGPRCRPQPSARTTDMLHSATRAGQAWDYIDDRRVRDRSTGRNAKDKPVLSAPRFRAVSLRSAGPSGSVWAPPTSAARPRQPGGRRPRTGFGFARVPHRPTQTPKPSIDYQLLKAAVRTGGPADGSSGHSVETTRRGPLTLRPS